MTCKDCLSYNVCKNFNPHIPEEFENIEHSCDEFKDKSLIVELPCKVGDTIYIPWKYDGLTGIAFFEVTHIIIDRNKSYIKTNFDTDDEGFYELYNGGEFVFDEIGKTFFLTCEAAEKALKAKEGE